MAEQLWRSWSLEPGIIVSLAIPAILFARGTRVASATTVLRKLCFWAGFAVLTLTLISPLHELSEALFSAHMLQHEILMLIAAPLLVWSRPLLPFLYGMPFEWRRRTGRWSKYGAVRAITRRITQPFSAWTLHAAALWVWHYPPLFDATLASEWVHAAQHLSFFGSALLFWWSLFYARDLYANRNDAKGMAVLYVFATGVHTGVLGALLTLSNRAWYPAYLNLTAPWGFTPIEDQQLGGLIMWVPASLIYLATGLSLFAGWMHASDREDTKMRLTSYAR